MITGSIVALATPMLDDGALDWPALERLVEFHVAGQTDAIVAVGTTGESATLNDEDHVAVIRRVVEAVAGRTRVIAGTGSNCTREAINLTREAAAAGVDACLLVTPYYNRPTQEGLYLHFKRLAEEVDVPQILYNVPGRTACDMQNETVARLADIPNIVGIKDATGNLDRGRELIAMVGDRLAVYSGDDATACDLILAGGKGNISVTANVAPAAMHEACMLALEGRADEAHAVDAKLRRLHEVLFVEANPIPVKWELHEMGLIGPGIRMPLTPLSESLRPELREALRGAGLLND